MCRSLGDRVAGIGEVEVGLFSSRAAVSDIGNEHAWEAVKTARATSNGNFSAVHVHLAIANGVEPGPCQNSISALGLLWNSEAIAFEDAVGTIGARASCGSGVQIAFGVGWACANKAVDNLPVRGILLLGLVGLIGQGDLA